MSATTPVETTQANALHIGALPDFPVETPCFVILEAAVRHNLEMTARRAGGIDRLMPHIKTHRAPWIVKLMIERGVRAVKTATPAEVEIAAAAGVSYVVWAYPTLNPLAIRRVCDVARANPELRICAMVDSVEGIEAWRRELAVLAAPNLRLRVDLDPGLGRTGFKIDKAALDAAHTLNGMGRFDGWHSYDGHIQDVDPFVRRGRITELAAVLSALMDEARARGLSTNLIAAGSYSYDLWPAALVDWVSPGSFVYSSSQHQTDLSQSGWKIGAYVLATVLSVRDGTATLDAGSKAISPDMPVKDRFVGPGRIRAMKEEHAIIEAEGLQVGQRVALVPKHACTAAYLYDTALVLGHNGTWEFREQLGSARHT